jgi:very-short-patch-repair endonuclease
MSAVYISGWEAAIGRVDSPIEAAFIAAFCRLAAADGFAVARMSSEPAFVITVQPQRWFGVYRVDFLIEYRFFGMTKRIIVECDGHEFHERTKVQAWRDKRRDRELPHKVYRFTGSEIHANATACASEILDMIVDFQSWASVVLHRRAVKEANARGKRLEVIA